MGNGTKEQVYSGAKQIFEIQPYFFFCNTHIFYELLEKPLQISQPQAKTWKFQYFSLTEFSS